MLDFNKSEITGRFGDFLMPFSNYVRNQLNLFVLILFYPIMYTDFVI